MILRLESPWAFAAITNSLLLMLRNSALTRREMPIQLVRPITTIMFQMLGSRKAITASIRKKVGKHIMRSTNLMITSSTTPMSVAMPTETNPTRRDTRLP